MYKQKSNTEILSVCVPAPSHTYARPDEASVPFGKNREELWKLGSRSSAELSVVLATTGFLQYYSCPRRVNAGNKNTQHAPSTKTECDYLNGWIRKRSHKQKSHPRW